MILLAVLAHVYEFDDKPLNKKMYRGKRDAVYTLHTILCRYTGIYTFKKPNVMIALLVNFC